MTKINIMLLASVLLFGCSSARFYHPSQLDKHRALLSDCTEYISQYLGLDVPEVPEGERDNAIIAASAWAEDNGYAPCPYEMCATITNFDVGRITVYVSYRMTPDRINEDGETIVTVGLGPEAEVTFSTESYQVLEQDMWHTGCIRSPQSRRMNGKRRRLILP